MPTKFEDEAGRTWDARISYRGMRDLAAAGLPLAEIEQHLQTLLCGGVELYDWLWALMAEQAKQHNLSREQFNDAIFDCSGRALAAFVDAVTDFFQRLNPTRARVFTAAIAEVEREMAAIFSGDAANSPEKSA